MAPPRPLTLASALESYVAAKGARLRPRTVEGCRSNMARYLADWLKLPLAEISGETVEGRHR